MSPIRPSLILNVSLIFGCLILINASPNNDFGNQKLPVDKTSTESPTSPLQIIASPQNTEPIIVGTTQSWKCNLDVWGEVWWMKNNKKLNSSSILRIENASIGDTGDYVCVGSTPEMRTLRKTIHIAVMEPVKRTKGEPIHVKLGGTASLSCIINGSELSRFEWYEMDKSKNTGQLIEDSRTSTVKLSENSFSMTLNLTKITKQDNRTYECRAKQGHRDVIHEITLVVDPVPKVKINTIKAVGPDSIYLSWTLIDPNEPTKNYTIQYEKVGTGKCQYQAVKSLGNNVSYVLENLESSTSYNIGITTIDFHDETSTDVHQKPITTLDREHAFLPKPFQVRATQNSITVGWNQPSESQKDNFYYYNVSMKDDRGTETEITTNLHEYNFDKLKPETSYRFKVAACSNYTKKCGKWGEEQSFRTSAKSAGSNSPNLQTAGLNVVLFTVLSAYFLAR